MKYILIIIAFLILSCNTEKISPLDNALQSEHPSIKKVMDNLSEHEV